MTDTTRVEKTVIGRVTSDKRQATCTVEMSWSRRHPRYGKVMKKRTKLQVHDPENQGRLGDLVEVKMVKPVSKTKCWNLVQVLERAPVL